MEITGFQEGAFPFRYLGVPVIANKLSKLECTQFMEKITKSIKVWATKSISYMGIVTLINSVLMGVFNFWATIFILPQGVIRGIERLCRNYLWGADDAYRKIPFVAWEKVC